jgi:hypothetical protein
MERKLGETFRTPEGVELEVVKNNIGKGCYYLQNKSCFKSDAIDNIGECAKSKRPKYGDSVSFKQINKYFL